MEKWLDKYDSGGKKKFLEPNDKKLPSGRIHPFYYQPSSELAQSIGGEEGEPAYLIPTFKYGHLLDNPLEEYKRTGEHLGGPFKTWQEADEWDKNIRHPYVEKNEALPSPLKRWGKDYENGGFLGTTNKGFNKNGAWGGQFQNGGIRNLNEVEVKDISPRQQAYNDSLQIHNLGRQLYADIYPDKKPQEFYNPTDRGVNPENFGHESSARYTADKLKKLEDKTGIKTNRFYDHYEIKNLGIDDGSYKYHFPAYKKPVYNPSSGSISPLQLQDTQLQNTQQSINPKQVPNGFTLPHPSYPQVRIQYSQDGKAMNMINSNGDTIPYGDGIPSREFAFPKKKRNGGWLNKYEQAQTGVTMPSFEERQKLSEEKAHQIMQQRETSSNDNSFSNISTDFGTRLLNAVGTLGGSAIGDAVSGVSPQAGDWLQKYSLGMIPHTSEEQLKANRSDNPDRWNNRIDQLGEALTNYAAAELVGQGMTKLAPKMGNLFTLDKGVNKARTIENIIDIPTNVPTKEPWQLIEPSTNTLQIKSTMVGSPLEKQLNKSGEININSLKAYINKADVGQQDKFILNKVVNEKFTGQSKIDYNDLRKAVSDELIPLEKNFTNKWANYGLKGIGYPGPASSSFADAIENGIAQENTLTRQIADWEGYKSNLDLWRKEHAFGKEVSDNNAISEIEKTIKSKQADLIDVRNQIIKNKEEAAKLPLRNESIIFENKEKFGKGSADHFSNETLGHSRVMVSKEEPEVMHILESQSDFYQKKGVTDSDLSLNKINKSYQDKAKNSIDLYKSAKKNRQGDYEVDYGNGNKALLSEEDLNQSITNLEQQIKLRPIVDLEQKVLLGKTHQERLLQENVAYAAEQGRSKLRYPTSETAAKIQGYEKHINPDRDWKIVNQELDDIKNGKITDGTKLHSDTKNFITGENNIGIVDVNDGFKPRPIDVLIKELEDKNAFNIAKERINRPMQNSSEPVYSLQHQTILKKYNDLPKMIKKTIGTEPKVVTDPKGNNWYEFNIPKKFREGKAEIKALSTLPIGIGFGLNKQSEEVEMQNGGEMSYYQHGLDFKPKMISQNGSVIAKNDATYASPYIDPNRVQDIRQELDDKYFDYNNYLSQANKYLSRPTFSNSVLKPKDIADASHEYYQKTGFKMPLSFLLTQAQQETKLGTQLKSKNNIFNIGNTTEGKTKDFDSPKESIDAYLELIHKDYLNQGDRSLDDLLKPKSFVNSQGHRYAKDPKYEKKLTNQMQFVNNFLQQKKDGGAIIKDNLGYWNPDNWGKPVEIDSPDITMRGVNQSLIGVSDEGDTKLLKPGKNYKFKGKKVTEYPIAKYGIQELHQLQDFTNKPSNKKNWLNKYSNG